MSSRPLSDSAANRAKKEILKLQKEKLTPEQVKDEMVQKGLNAEMTAKLTKEIRDQRFSQRMSIGLSSLEAGIIVAGAAFAAQQGWIEFNSLSDRRVIVLIIAGLVGVVMIGIGICVMVEAMLKANKK